MRRTVLTFAVVAAVVTSVVPVRMPGTPAQPQGFGGSGAAAAQQALTGYYAMEARNFANGERSILDIRNALAAEFGPVSLDDVTKFFRDAEKAGTYTVSERTK